MCEGSEGAREGVAEFVDAESDFKDSAPMDESDSAEGGSGNDAGLEDWLLGFG